MLRVTLGEDNVEVRFHHGLFEPEDTEKMIGHCVDGNRRYTTATIVLNGNLVFTGISICHSDDNFCRSLGRKKALADSLQSLTKELRTAVWVEYEAMCGF
jgi:hypothetical protein